MQVFKGAAALSQELKSPVVTIGNFDGVHLGHRAIILEAISQARSLGGVSVCFTFKPHPQRALRPDHIVPLLSTYEEKIDLIADLGVDVLIEEAFTRDFSTRTPEQFFSDVLIKRIGARSIVVGYDFGFGKDRAGSLDKLRELCSRMGVQLTVIEPQDIGGVVPSSSKIRAALNQGDVRLASKLLGRTFFYHGVVVKGDQRGRKLGFPTANLKVEEKILVPFGVYATETHVLGRGGEARVFQSVTNVGVRPTFVEESQALVETHLLDFSEDLYGTSLCVHFLEKIRDEKKFESLEALKTQIAKDCVQARER